MVRRTHICTLSTDEDGWVRELNKVDWGEGEVYDIRSWSPDYKYMQSVGISLTETEMRALVNGYQSQKGER